MGRRIGSHGAGTWSFPGGHLEWNETVDACAARELLEETGLVISTSAFRKLTYTNDVFTNEGKHYVTLYMEAQCPEGEPQVMEPTKCSEWAWTEAPPEPLFLPIQNLLREGWQSALWKGK
jgi:8-oxo-dGTP diphosphatase